MLADNFRVLVRVAVELSTRCAAIRRYLDQIGPGEGLEYQPIGETIRKALDGIEAPLFPTLDAVSTSLKAAKIGHTVGLEVLGSYLAKLSRWFKTIHELLVYLPRRQATPETISVLEASFGSLYSQHKPSIILGSLFNALEFDFLALMRDRLPDLSDIIVDKVKRIVLQLAICDREAAHAWSILAHELGHAIDHHENISLEVTKAFVRDSKSPAFQRVNSWCKELSADLIAARALGPAPILALLSLEYCLFPIIPVHQSSPSHPATRWRLKIVLDYLNKHHGKIPFLEKERHLYEAAVDFNLDRFVTDPADRRLALQAGRRQYEFIFSPVAGALSDKIDQLDIPSFALAENSLERCNSRLRQGLPISAQGISREELRSRLSDYRSGEPELPDKAADFKELAKLFKEDPLGMPIIFFAASKRRSEASLRMLLTVSLSVTASV